MISPESTTLHYRSAWPVVSRHPMSRPHPADVATVSRPVPVSHHPSSVRSSAPAMVVSHAGVGTGQGSAPAPAMTLEGTSKNGSAVPDGAGTASMQKTTSVVSVPLLLPQEQAWPAWSKALAVVIVSVAFGLAVYWTAQAARDQARLLWRKAPRRLVWAFRTSLVLRAGLAMLASFLVSFLVMNWAIARSDRPTEPTTHPQTIAFPAPTAPMQAMRTTSMGTHANFVKTVVPMLEGQGLTHEQAVLFTAHLARETGWGRWVYRNNFGNIKAGDWRGETFEMTDARGFRGKYRTWQDPESGLQAALSIVRDTLRYRRAWSMLQAHDTRWYGQLGVDGYYEGPPDRANPSKHTVHSRKTVEPVQREYEGIVSLVRRYQDEDRT